MTEKQGRPTKYNEEYHVPWAIGLLRRGLTIDQLAEEFGVARSTIYLWAKEHKTFSDALNTSRELADMKVEATLYNRAVGMSVTDTKRIIQTAKDGEPKTARVEVTEHQLAPDVTAFIFWLKNRNPKLWRDKQDIQFAESDDESIKNIIGMLGLDDDTPRS